MERKTSLFPPPPFCCCCGKAAEEQLTYFLSSAALEAPQHLTASLCLSPEACLMLKGLALVRDCKEGNSGLLLDHILNAGKGLKHIAKYKENPKANGRETRQQLCLWWMAVDLLPGSQTAYSWGKLLVQFSHV